MTMSTDRKQTGAKGEPTGRVGSLRFHLAASIIVIVLVGMTVSLAVGYVLEYKARVGMMLASLMEQAHSLEVARDAIRSDSEYAAFVDRFCARMNAEISPGHHILVTDATGNVTASSRRHSGPEVEHALLSAEPDEPIIALGDRELAQVRLRTGDGSVIIVAQYLGHMKDMIRRQMFTRGISTGLIGLLILVLLLAAMRRWVLKPIGELKLAGHAWSRRDFAVRAAASGPQDVRSLAAEFNRMASELEGYESRRLAEMAKARRIQAGFLPVHLPAIPGLAEIIARYEPAEDVAGDLYDIIPLPDGRTAIVVLDVSGHGVSAALLTGIAKMALHWRLAEQDALRDVVAKVNADLVRCLTDGQFVTMCVGVWNPKDSTWTYCAAGHPGGALQMAENIEHLSSTGPLLGAIEEAHWTERVVALQPGQRLWLYTDGLIEAGAPDHKLDLEGLERILCQTAGRPLDEQASVLIREAVSRQRPEEEDDVTIVAIECLAGGHAEGGKS